jgi:hypothetical protein
MKYLTADAIRQINDRGVTEVQVPEWGGSVLLRPLSAAEALQFAEATEQDRRAALVRVVILSVVDEAGNRLFTDADAEWLAAKNFRALLRIQEAVLELNGLGDVAVKAAKNA